MRKTIKMRFIKKDSVVNEIEFATSPEWCNEATDGQYFAKSLRVFLSEVRHIVCRDHEREYHVEWCWTSLESEGWEEVPQK